MNKTLFDPDGIGLRGTFTTPYEEFAEHKGKRYVYLGRVDPTTYDAEEVGPMYLIRLETGEELSVWPEEVEEDSAS